VLLRGVQQKFHLHGVEREFDAAAFRAHEQPGVEQRLHVTVDGLDVATGAPCCLADRHRPRTAQRLQRLRAFGRQHPPQQLGRGERDARRSLRLARFPGPNEVPHRVRRRADFKRHGSRFPLAMSRWKSAITFSGR
jgi:hypothetical protein